MTKGLPQVRRDLNLLHRDGEQNAPVWRDADHPHPYGNNSKYNFLHLKLKVAEVPLEPEQIL